MSSLIAPPFKVPLPVTHGLSVLSLAKSKQPTKGEPVAARSSTIVHECVPEVTVNGVNGKFPEVMNDDAVKENENGWVAIPVIAVPALTLTGVARLAPEPRDNVESTPLNLTVNHQWKAESRTRRRAV
jgi:hypothetical protein